MQEPLSSRSSTGLTEIAKKNQEPCCLKVFNILLCLATIGLFIANLIISDQYICLAFIAYAIQKIVFHTLNHRNKVRFIQRSKVCVHVSFGILLVLLMVNVILAFSVKKYVKKNTKGLFVVSIITVILQGMTFILLIKKLTSIYKDEVMGEPSITATHP